MIDRYEPLACSDALRRQPLTTDVHVVLNSGVNLLCMGFGRGAPLLPAQIRACSDPNS